MTDLEKRIKKDTRAWWVTDNNYSKLLSLETLIMNIVKDETKELEAENEQIKNSDTLCKLIGEQKIKIAELEKENKVIYQRTTMLDETLENKNNKIAELEAQIEKMKHTEQKVMDKLWKEWDILLGVSN